MEKMTKLSDFLETFRKEAFLQSEIWRKFQESEGKKTFHLDDIIKEKNGEVIFRIWANIIEHTLPVVGKYFYVPRGPVICGKKEVNLMGARDMKKSLDYFSWLAKDNGVSWIRLEPRSEKDLNLIKEATLKIAKEKRVKMEKAPHNMQPEEIFVVDISKPEDELLKEMKSKTRYNIRLAEKKGVCICAITKKQETITKKIPNSNSPAGEQIPNSFYLEEFLRLNLETAERDRIITHPDEHYRKMVEVIPSDILQIYVAEYQGRIIAANLVIFFEDTAIYLHGASSSENRDAMAPYLLQWRQIQDAKAKGCKYYDFGGIKTKDTRYKIQDTKSWEGITRFKTGFSPKTESIVFPGSYDFVINLPRYRLYRIMQKIKNIIQKVLKTLTF